MCWITCRPDYANDRSFTPVDASPHSDEGERSTTNSDVLVITDPVLARSHPLALRPHHRVSAGRSCRAAVHRPTVRADLFRLQDRSSRPDEATKPPQPWGPPIRLVDVDWHWRPFWVRRRTLSRRLPSA